MVGSLIQSVPEAKPFHFDGDFGINLGLDIATEGHVGTDKYHLYTRADVARALHSWMERRHGAAPVEFDDIFIPRQPTEEFPDASYMTRLSSGYDFVNTLTFPRAIEGSENAAATLLGQMDTIAKRVMPEVLAGSGLLKRLNTKRDYVPVEHYTNKPLAYNFSGLHNPDQAAKTNWLKSHISPRSFAFWLNRAVFVDLVQYGGVMPKKYDQAEWHSTK